MMIRSRTATLLASTAMAVSLLALPSGAVEEGPQFVEQQTYFICDGPSPVTQVNQAVAGAGTPTWGPDAPTGAVSSGSACGTVGSSPAAQQGVWEGTFTGNLNTMAIELHQLAPQNAAYGDISITVTVIIDGQVKASTEVADPLTFASDSGASYQVNLGLDKIGLVDDEDGAGTEEHTIRLEVDPNFSDSGSVVGWVWGATEIPAGITFNGSVKGASKL